MGAGKDKAYIISTQHGYMEGQQLHGDDCDNTLQAIHCVWHVQVLICKYLGIHILLVTYDNWAALKRPIDRQERRGYIGSQRKAFSCG